MRTLHLFYYICTSVICVLAVEGRDKLLRYKAER